MFICFHCLALPIGIPLMFYTSLRSAAYWWALAVNLTLQSIVLGVLVGRTDWSDQIKQAQERAGMIADENGSCIIEEKTDESKEHKEYQNGSFHSSLDGLKPKDNEKTPLIDNTPTRRKTLPPRKKPSLSDLEQRVARKRLLSVSLSKAEIKTLTETEDHEPLGQVLMKRLLVILVVIGILGAGVAVRIFVPIPGSADEPETMSTTKGLSSNGKHLNP